MLLMFFPQNHALSPGSVNMIDTLCIYLYVICISLLYAWKREILATKNLFFNIIEGDIHSSPKDNSWVSLS